MYSQNKNEDDFLENLGLLTQVIKEQKEQDEKDAEGISYSGDEDLNQEEIEEPAVVEDSFTMTVNEAISQGYIEQPAAAWSVEQKENRKVSMTYKAYKRIKDLKDFGNSLERAYKQSNK